MHRGDPMAICVLLHEVDFVCFVTALKAQVSRRKRQVVVQGESFAAGPSVPACVDQSALQVMASDDAVDVTILVHEGFVRLL